MVSLSCHSFPVCWWFEIEEDGSGVEGEGGVQGAVWGGLQMGGGEREREMWSAEGGTRRQRIRFKDQEN